MLTASNVKRQGDQIQSGDRINPIEVYNMQLIKKKMNEQG